MESFNFLMKKNIKAIVIACNTASALAMEEAQAIFDIPIIGGYRARSQKRQCPVQTTP